MSFVLHSGKETNILKIKAGIATLFVPWTISDGNIFVFSGLLYERNIQIGTALHFALSFFLLFFFSSSEEKMLIQKQMAYMLGRLQIFLELDEDMEDCDDLTEIISNSHLNNNFLALAREVIIIYSLLHYGAVEIMKKEKPLIIVGPFIQKTFIVNVLVTNVIVMTKMKKKIKTPVNKCNMLGNVPDQPNLRVKLLYVFYFEFLC